MTQALPNIVSSLYERFGHLPGVTIEVHKELVAINIINDVASGTIFLQGAQVTHYERHCEPPILWLSDACDYKAGVPLRGGIPVCWPWFANLSHNPDDVKVQIDALDTPKGAHGLVRSINWTVEDIVPQDNETHLCLMLLPHEEIPEWPYQATLKLMITIGAELTVKLEVHNTGERSFVHTCALHSYFSVGDIEQTSITGLEDATYIDALKEWASFQQHGTLSINEEVDRIYQLNSVTSEKYQRVAQIHDTSNNRVINLHQIDAKSLVVWNPWIEKSKQLSNFPNESYQEMICLETANTLTHMRKVTPGGLELMGFMVK
ncbi:D-hexose-6-phosphate mutarotase [Marinibactrum halimedae]|uniref:Putative glucose-6-phosphate 1-epimerase n=1 Tax=Marinibactrum halimedae TaxID=1444977 RepID=A0AA37WLM1_9GAMM|nr:D-hexose-6-phosphate mutarotase [Marinibactrum halimedae]MCD9459348.1 D-hexose-6-phosphate mutarotase [Marinibactrum halimedae]GLS25758.1 D-hexose-6-phosphate mutarotase [Marinibactrum halimedae]